MGSPFRLLALFLQLLVFVRFHVLDLLAMDLFFDGHVPAFAHVHLRILVVAEVLPVLPFPVGRRRHDPLWRHRPAHCGGVIVLYRLIDSG